MKVIADFHIHSKYSRATSEHMDVDEIVRYAPVKGLNLVGTGDFTHAQWLKELKENLVKDEETGLYKPTKAPNSSLRFMVTGEAATIFPFNEETKKIHHLILTPSLETAAQINDRLSRYGSLVVDGRPVLNMTAAALVEEVMEASRENVVIPAHIWTPWFSLFGDLSGFDRIEDCYQDTIKHIFAVETGLSSDPPMNWRLSALDRFTLVSNSDSHSSWPWRIGREANVFDLERLSYGNVVDAIRSKDPKRFLFTIETYPEYGKYHWTGHRNCKVSLSMEEVKKYGGICPVCHRKLTKGVEQRVDELADRPSGFKPESVPGFRRLLPLSEVIQAVLGTAYPGTQKVWNVYNLLISKFGNEYTVLIDAPFKELAETVDPTIADAIVRVREERLNVVPGYDGVYGQIEIIDESEKKTDESRDEQQLTQQVTRRETRKQTGQKRLADFI
jgi:uncharacterized protein (TIGR00375 family)